MSSKDQPRIIPGFRYDPQSNRYYRTTGEPSLIASSGSNTNSESNIGPSTRTKHTATRALNLSSWSFVDTLDDKRRTLRIEDRFPYHSLSIQATPALKDPMVVITKHPILSLASGEWGNGQAALLLLSDFGPRSLLQTAMRPGPIDTTESQRLSSPDPQNYDLHFSQTNWLFCNRVRRCIALGSFLPPWDPPESDEEHFNQLLNCCSFSADGSALVYSATVYCSRPDCPSNCEHAQSASNPHSKLFYCHDMPNRSTREIKLPEGQRRHLRGIQALSLTTANELFVSRTSPKLCRFVNFRLADRFELPERRSAYWIHGDAASCSLLARTYHEELFWFDLRYPKHPSCIFSIKSSGHGNATRRQLFTLPLDDGRSIILSDPSNQKRILGIDLRRTGVPFMVWDAQTTIHGLFMGYDETGRQCPIVQLRDTPISPS